MRWRTCGSYGWGRRGWYGNQWDCQAPEVPVVHKPDTFGCCPSSLREALYRNLGKCVEVFTAASCDVVGDSERIGTICCVNDCLLELKPLDCQGDRTVYFDLGHVIGFQVAKGYGDESE